MVFYYIMLILGGHATLHAHYTRSLHLVCTLVEARHPLAHSSNTPTLFDGVRH
jgi:hypothetical protein